MKTTTIFSGEARLIFRLALLFIMLSAPLTACKENETNNQPATAEPNPTIIPTTDQTGLPNPASVYCQEQGYPLEMRQDADGGSYGVCLFPDGSECDEWAFYRGECHPGDSLTPVASLTEPTDEPAITLAEDGWQIYHSPTNGYTFHFPPDATIEPGNDPANNVTFQGPLLDDNYWPMIFISHPTDIEGYRPPQEVDLAEWLINNNLLPPQDVNSPPEVRLDDVTIAGIAAVHSRFDRSPQSYAFDKYFFARNGQLYVIVILHTADKEDWDLYNHFLDSFQFDS